MDFTAKRKLAILIPAFGLVWWGCSIGNQADVILPPMYEEFATRPLVMNPVTATEAGYHAHSEPGDAESATEINLDEMLGDYSSTGIQERISFYRDFDATLHSEDDSVPREELKGDLWTNYRVVENRARRALFEWETRKQYETDPNFYLEILGRALFDPLVLNYASADARFGHIIARLEKVPEFLSQAQGNLQSSSELQIQAAKGQISDLVSLVNNDIPAQLPSALSGQYEGASGAAVTALEGFSAFLDGLATSGDWRLGGALFDQKLKVDSGLDTVGVDSLLAELQREYDAVYKDLIEAAGPIHRSIYGNQRPPSEYALMRDILDIVSDENRLRSEDGIVDRVVGNIDEAKAFMQSEELLPFPADVDLSVSETPAFLRTRFPVGAFQAPPALNPSLGAEYWLTRLPEDASRGAVLAKLREYNNFKLEIVAVDAFARYVQAALSRTGIPDETSRLIRNVDGNRAYTRGWAIYLVESTMNLGFNSGNNQFKLNWLKYKLEFLASAMLDIQLHTQNLPVEDARTMLQRQVFMETGAITSALRSIQLNPTDNAIAYIGAQQWRRVRDTYQEATTDFSYSSFHGKALRAGPLPPEELVYVTTEGQGELSD